VIFAPIKNALAFPVCVKPVDIDAWPYIGVMLGPCEVPFDDESVFPRQTMMTTCLEVLSLLYHKSSVSSSIALL